MDLIILPQHWSALLCILIMIFSLIIASIKKWSMTYTLLIANFVIFVISMIYYQEVVIGLETAAGEIYPGLGFRPIYLSTEYAPQNYTVFTSMFIHGGFAHILGNMLVLFFIGTAFEDRIGSKKFIIIYLATGIIGTLTHSFANIGSDIPLVGASGAIFGIMGAFAFSYPRDEVLMPIPLGIIMIIRRIKVIYAVMLFAILETVVVFWDVQDSTAHLAHLGGLISGLILAAILLRGRKTHTKTGRTIYYDSYQSNKLEKVDFSKLWPLATTEELKSMLRRIESETVPQVRDIWLEHFIEKAVCPKCGDKLFRMDDKIWCDKCGFKTKI